MSTPSAGGSFLPSADYVTTGDWTFAGDVAFTGSVSDTGSTFASPTLTGTVAGAASYTTPTLVTPVISTGLSASGSAANTFAGSTGTFITSTGANTLSGSVTIADATTPSLTTAAGKTNTGFLLLNGKTSGSFKILPADATAQAVILSIAAQTVGGSTLTIPDQAGASSSLVLTTLAQTLTNKTLTAPILGVATGTSLAVTGLLKTSSPSAGLGYATGSGGTCTQGSSKSTTVSAVPDPSLCGSITTHNATLNAGVIVSFTFTNSAIAATDVLVLNHISGGTIGSYTLNAQCGTGSATINIRNNTAGNLGEALVIQYALVRGVNA